MTRKQACEKVAKSLRDFGYPDVTTAMIDEILTAWLKGDADEALPHGIIGMMASAQFEDVEREAPGILATLT